MLVKCICANCAGHLEFEEENAGQKIQCPHCGFDTILYLPGAEKAEAEVASLTRKLEIHRRVLLLVGVVVVFGAAVWAVHHWILPLFAGWLPETESKALPIIMAAIVCLAFPLLVAWMVFPLVWFLQTRRLIGLLERMEENLRFSQAAAVPESFSRPDLVATEETEKL